MSHKILIIEDEPTLAKLLTYNLSQQGYETQVVEHGGEGLQHALHNEYGLIMLDLMLPGMNGFDILTQLRQQGVNTPVIILTARDAEEEIVQGLTSGADDYITKPFGVAELFARVSAVLRRVHAEDSPLSSGSGTTDSHKEISMGDLKVYPDKYEVVLAGKSISLRPKEFEVLLYLIQRPGIVITRDQLMDAVWGFDFAGGQRTVDVHVSTLRKKLEMNQQTVRIESIRGVGYKFIA